MLNEDEKLNQFMQSIKDVSIFLLFFFQLYFLSVTTSSFFDLKYLLKCFAGKEMSLTFAVPKSSYNIELFVWEWRFKRHVITKKKLQWQKKSQDL